MLVGPDVAVAEGTVLEVPLPDATVLLGPKLEEADADADAEGYG